MIPIAFALIADIAATRGVANIAALPGCWEFTAGRWSIAVNGGREPRKSTAGHEVPPFSAFAWHDSLIGLVIVTPNGGAVGGAGAEDALIEALRAELEATP